MLGSQGGRGQRHWGVSMLGGEHSDEEYVEEVKEEPKRGHRSFSLVPAAVDYSPDDLVDPSAGYIAALSREKMTQMAPVLLWQKVYEANKKKAQADVERLTYHFEDRAKEQAVKSVVRASAAYVTLLSHVFGTIHGPEASPVEPTRAERLREAHGMGLPYQRLCVKYKVFSLRPGAGGTHNQRPTQGVETWTCVMPWSLARDTVDTSQHEMYWRNIYIGLHESCPRHNRRLARIRYLLQQGLRDSFFSRAEKHDRLQGHAEPPETTINTERFYWSGTDSAGHMHSLMAGGLNVRTCADHMVPQLFKRFRTQVYKAANGYAKTQVTNLFTLALRIDAPLSEGDAIWESHILELSPYAGEDACTVNHIFLESSYKEGGVNAFLYKNQDIPEEANKVEHRAQPSGELDHVQGMVCIGAHRGLRYSELDLLKVHAQGHEKWWWGVERPDLTHQTLHDAYAARVSIEDWDFVFSSFKVKKPRKTGFYNEAEGKADIKTVWDEEVKSVITAVHYPPYITNDVQHSVGGGPRILKKREEGVAEPFYVHLVVGNELSASYRDDERNYIYYIPFLHKRRSPHNRVEASVPYLQGLDRMEREFRRIKKVVSTQFMDKWPRGGNLHKNILLLSKKRDVSSPLHIWAQEWRQVIWESMHELHKFTLLDPSERQQYWANNTSLLAYGYWQLSPQIPQHEQERLWIELLMAGGCPTREVAVSVHHVYVTTFLPRYLPDGVPPFQAPPPRHDDSSSESGMDARAGAIRRPSARGEPTLVAKLSQLERRLAQSEQSVNVRHLLERVLTRLDEGQVE